MTDTAARLDAIVKAYDIRGLVPAQLDESTAAALGAGFAAFLLAEDPTADRVLIGRDMRESGIGLVEAFTRNIVAAGLDVIDLGLISTDMLYFAAGSLDASGVVFTASHNPAEYNGFKMTVDKSPFFSDDIYALGDEIIANKDTVIPDNTDKINMLY